MHKKDLCNHLFTFEKATDAFDFSFELVTKFRFCTSLIVIIIDLFILLF